MPANINVTLRSIYLAGNIMICLVYFQSDKITLNRKPLLFSLTLFMLSVSVVHMKDFHWSTSFYYLTGYISYMYAKNLGNIQSILEKLISIAYVFFIGFYYIKLPDLFDRVGFDENVFDTSSSNSIAIILNIYLLTYICLGVYTNRLNETKAIRFGLINIILIFIQQSRIGLVISLFILFLPIASKYKISYLKTFTLLFVTLVSLIFINQYFGEIVNIKDFALGGYTNDSRGLIQLSFIENLKGDMIFWGYPKNHIYLMELKRVYNVFLFNYNQTTVIGFIIIILVLILRIFYSKKYFFNITFLVPIIFYLMVEEIFLAMPWDFLFYLLLFEKLNQPKVNEIIK